jgi:serine/threonine protein kinase
MKDRKAREKEFKALEMSIERLKKAEIELAELKPPGDIFGPQIESIMSKLKDPSKVDEVEQELAVLRGQVKQYEESQRQAAKPQEASTKSAPQRASYPFPRELEELYRGIEFIGSGGFARVFRAKRRADGIEVAIKVPINMDASTGKSFVREINAWQNLKHMNIVRLYDLNILPIPYLEMELCSQSLHELRKPLEIERAAGMMFHIAEGVKYAHSRGIVHRDLKPQNILLQGETPKIGDWGLSRVVAESTSSTRFAFSPIYATPEQLLPQQFGKPDHRTDIYQLGALFYELVTDRPPFKGDNITELMAQIVASEPIGPSSLNPASSAVEHVIMKCLRKQMPERYQSVAEMQKDLAEYLEVEYQDSLRKSQGNMKRSGYYCAELCLVHLRIADLPGALKYAHDLNHYASGQAKGEISGIIEELELRHREDLPCTDELMDRVAVVLHQVKMGR